MKHWLRDTHFRSILRNSSYLAVSKGIAGVAGVATLAFAGRGLGLATFGVLILITSYAKAASGLSQFQSWQLIIRYSGLVLTSGEAEDFRASTGFAFALDVVSGIGGMIVAVALLPFIGGLFGIGHQYVWLAMLYCTLLPTMASATPVGFLRALACFDLIGWQGTTYPIARAILAGAGFAASAPLEIYVAIWFVTDLGGDLYLWFLAWRELRRRGLLEGIRPTVRPTSRPAAWSCAIQVNLTASLQTAWGPIGRLAVGGLLGTSAAALFSVASSLADSAQKPADFLAKAFYPEIIRMDLATKHPWRLMLRSAALAGAVALALVLLLLAGERPLIGLLFGKDFLDAYAILIVLMLAPLIGVLTFPLPSMLYALNRADAPLRARLVGTFVYFAAIAPLCLRFGVIGAAWAFVLAYATMALLLSLDLRREYRRFRRSHGA